MPKAVIYVRVSTEEQTQNYSLESQEKECRAYAQRHNYEIDKVFREEGASGKTIAGRPVLKELLAYSSNKKNNLSFILVYKYDRWARNTSEGLGLITLVAKYGVDVQSITEPTGNNAMGKAMTGLMLVVAQLENDVKSERTKLKQVDGLGEPQSDTNIPL